MEHLTDSLSVKELKDILVKNSISLAMQGTFSQDVMMLIQAKINKLPNQKIISKKIFALVIEMAQNIHHYSDNRVFSEKYGKDIGVGILTISENETKYIITSGNYVSAEDAKEINSRFKYLNKLNDEELKELYKKYRKQPQRENKPGANLGFIDMRRKSGNPLDYEIQTDENSKSFFILSVKVNKEL
ncbi:SiaB family protein kinase [Flexithrix dorotheae]|uniref:SiaB family protein kinase n=1 Tax=Flexithrix dorotheae TaxID=70993 RepID=UPI000368186E|nr:SiaB family protein kinase [Flexithrix dorotheae]